MSSRPGRLATLLLSPALVLLIAACSGATTSPSAAPSGGPSTAPSSGPSATPDAEAIDHPTGATDVILRYEEGGGFVMAGFAATQVPHFTLYGDGTIVYRDPTLEFPPMEGNVARMNPLRTAKLSEEQIQDLLRTALTEGGLAVARPEYTNDMIADASTAIFTVNAGGVTKTVSVYALGLDLPPGSPDAAPRAAFSALAQSLTSIEAGGQVAATDYMPTAYRGVLFEAQGLVDPDIQDWPWADFDPADFVPDADPNGLQFPHRTLSPADVEALGFDGFEGGLQNVPLNGTDGKLYTMSVRPLLPDEAS